MLDNMKVSRQAKIMVRLYEDTSKYIIFLVK